MFICSAFPIGFSFLKPITFKPTPALGKKSLLKASTIGKYKKIISFYLKALREGIKVFTNRKGEINNRLPDVGKAN